MSLAVSAVSAVTTISNPSGLVLFGAACFGSVIGYITTGRWRGPPTRHRSLTWRQSSARSAETPITVVYGPADGTLFALYSIGLVIGMVLYLIASLLIRGKTATGGVLARTDHATRTRPRAGSSPKSAQSTAARRVGVPPSSCGPPLTGPRPPGSLPERGARDRQVRVLSADGQSRCSGPGSGTEPEPSEHRGKALVVTAHV